MEGEYKIININEYLSDKDLEQEVKNLIETFSSPKNEDVEVFLKEKAILFTRKGQSVTYLVYRVSDIVEFVGYFTLAIKPVSIDSKSVPLSKNFMKRLERVCKVDDDGLYVLSAYLIAQLGKNYSLQKERRIDGKTLLSIAQNILTEIKYQVGGVVSFLECEDSEDDFLKRFYEQNGFSLFSERISEKNKKLYQLLKAL